MSKKKQPRKPALETGQSPLADPGSEASVPVSRQGRTWFRLFAAFGIPLGILLFTEFALRVAGYGYQTHFFQKRPLEDGIVWTDNQSFGRRFFPPGLVRYPRPITLPSAKGTNTLRIFVLGESAAMGDPDPKFGLPRMLEVLLRERFPTRKFEVVNAAMVAINSHVILPIAKDCASQQGDLWVIYMGNNEVIGPFGSASVFGARAPALPIVRAGLAMKTTALGQLMDSGLYLVRRGNQVLPTWGGMQMMSGQKVRYNDPATARVYHHFERNLNDILRTGVQAKVPMILCTVATNLKDCPPFVSAHRANLTAAELATWQKTYDAGVELQGQGKTADARKAFDEAALTDDEFADLAFRRGQCCRLLGQDAEAARFFREARDKDALQFRADGHINGAIRQAAGRLADQKVCLLDAEEILAKNSPQGLAGVEHFYEHVHLNPEGNYLLARSVADQVVQTLNLEPTGEWVTLSECLRLLGFTDVNHYELFDTMRDRMQVPPFTGQIDHARQMQWLDEQIARYRGANKPAQVKRNIQTVSKEVGRHPADPDLRWNLAALLDNGGDKAGAEEQWRTLIRLQPQAALSRINLAKLLERLGQDTEAFTLYSESLRINPDYSPARHALGMLSLRLGRLPEAIQCLSVVVAQKPEEIAARMALAEAFAQAHQMTDAEKQLQEVLRVDPKNETALAKLKALEEGR